MLTKGVLFSTAVLILTVSQLAAQVIDPESVQALRQMAIEAGQTSSSADQRPAKSQEVIDAERRSIERHRVDFFARVYSGGTYSEAERDRQPRTPAEAPQLVDSGTVQALRQMAIEAGQTSSSSDQPPAKSQETVEAERISVERHRADFFARAYGGKLVS